MVSNEESDGESEISECSTLVALLHGVDEDNLCVVDNPEVRENQSEVHKRK